MTLRWDDVDRSAGELHIRDGKTGHRRAPLTPAVEEVLERIPRIEGNPWVITGQKAGGHLTDLDAVWLRLRQRAGPHGVRIHDCRHSYASRALGARRRGADDRQAAWPPQGDDDRALCAPGAGYREGVGGERRRQHRRQPSVATRGCGLRRKRNRHGEAHHDDDLETHRRSPQGGEGHGLLGFGSLGLRRSGVPVGEQALRCADPRGREGGQTGDGGPSRDRHGGGSEAPCSAHHRAHQGGRGAGAGAACGDARREPHGGRSRQGVSRRARGGAMQARRPRRCTA